MHMYIDILMNVHIQATFASYVYNLYITYVRSNDMYALLPNYYVQLYIVIYIQFFYHYRFFLAIIVYFVAGMIIRKVKYEKTGSDIIPNKAFWIGLPSLVKVN